MKTRLLLPKNTQMLLLCAEILFRFVSACVQISVQGTAADIELFGCLGLVVCAHQRVSQYGMLAFELVVPPQCSPGPPQSFPLGLQPVEGFLGPLAYELPLYLGTQAEGKGQHLTLDVIPQTVIVLYRPHLTLLRHADVQDFHNHKEVSAQTRQFTAYNDVIFSYPFQEDTQLPFCVVLCPTDGFLYPVVNLQLIVPAKPVDFVALVFHRLPVAAHSDVTVDHRFNL